MFAPDLHFIGFTATEWIRLLESMRPSDEPATEPAAKARGGLILVTEGRSLIKLVHTDLGRLDAASEPWPEALPELAKRHSARWAIEVQVGALDSVFDRFAERMHPDDDSLKQLLSLLGLMREAEAEGRLRVWPSNFSQWPIPSHRTVLRALDTICPLGQTLLFGVFHQGVLYTCLAARRAERGFDRIVGPSVLRPSMGLVSGDWTRDYRHLLQATEELLGPVAVGCYAELSILQRLAASKRRGAWAESIALREVILTPVVPALAIPVGIDAGLAALQGVRVLAERAKALDWLAPDGPVRALLNRVQAVKSSGPQLKSILGFDPLALLYELLEKRSHRD